MQFHRFYDEHGSVAFSRSAEMAHCDRWQSRLRRKTAATSARPSVATRPSARSARASGGVVCMTDRREQVSIMSCSQPMRIKRCRILGDVVPVRERGASAFSYARSEVILHQDDSANAVAQGGLVQLELPGADRHGFERPVPVTYWMNRLQNIDPRFPLFASLNPWTPPARPGLGRYEYEHPCFRATPLRTACIGDDQGAATRGTAVPIADLVSTKMVSNRAFAWRGRSAWSLPGWRSIAIAFEHSESVAA